MPGAEQDLELVPLEADRDGFTILGRFPVGFRRTVPGGYLAAEDVIVLDGRLELEGRSYGRGTLVHIPARYLRTSMCTPEGCLVLAWFSGNAVFRRPDELEPVATSSIRSVEPARAGAGDLLVTEVSHWSVVSAASRPPEADAVNLDLTIWTRAGTDWLGSVSGWLVVRVAQV